MKKSLSDLLCLTKSGLIITAIGRTTSDLTQIVAEIGLNSSHVTIKNADNITLADLLLIAGNYPQNVTFEFNQ